MTQRRDFMVSFATGIAASLPAGAALWRNASAAPMPAGAACPSGSLGTGALSGKPICNPVEPLPVPSLVPPGVIKDGRSIGNLGIDPGIRYPDVRSHRKKLGVLVPATNTSVEHELYGLVFRNQANGLDGVGLHAASVITPRPRLRNAADLIEYKRQFLGGLRAALEAALLARPHALIMGMSLEHILYGIDEIRATMAEVAARSGLFCATWHDAAQAALGKLGARRIGLLTPFDATGNKNAARMFEDLGFQVVTSVGFACGDAQHIAHIPDFAKERAISEHLATKENRLDAIVQCGTNMSLIDVTERLEPKLGIPILGINATTFWYALRELGFSQPIIGAGRLLREH